MLPREHRLRHDRDIKTLFSKGKGVFDGALGLKYRKNDGGVSRFAVVVGGKVSKNAVERNRIRRKIREGLHARLSRIASGYDVIVMARPEAARKKNPELEANLERLLKKTPLLRV